MIRLHVPALVLTVLSMVLGANASAAESVATVPTDRATSVERGRAALGSQWSYPWYDGSKDDLFHITPPVPPKPWGWRWPFGLTGLQVLAYIGLALLVTLLATVFIQTYLNRENSGSGGDEQSTEAAAAQRARVQSLPFRLDPDKSDLLAEARLLYEQGSYALAMIYLFSYELTELDRYQVIRMAKGKTNRQYLREMSPRPALRGLVEQTVVAFEEVFFGNRPLERERFEICWNRLEEFDSAVGQQGAS
jgi:hypothetical protein